MGRKLLIAFGRALFLGLFIAQCYCLVRYTVEYEENGDFLWLLTLCFLPGLIAWLVVIIKSNGRISLLGLIWLFYTLCALTPMLGLIFGRTVIENKLDNTSFWGANMLKTTICVTPWLLLLLVHSTTDDQKYRKLLDEISFTFTLDLFDGIEMLEVIIEEDVDHRGVPKELEIAILACVCGFICLSPLEFFQFKFDEEDCEYKSRTKMVIIRKMVHALLNLSFLVLRLILWFKYGRNALIFITKNSLSIIQLLLGVFSTISTNSLSPM